MSYLVLARKYRPDSFASVTGQEHVTRTLSNAIKKDRVAHAYLLSGPRGVGKTSIARIFAKSLNCEQGPSPSPCLECKNCEEITQGNSLAVREVDGASHNSVDHVRDLIESFRSLPAPGSRYKVYIIDEVHMLSLAAFNALLKSLEEPPPHTVLIFATTEPHKIPDTVLSRCQRLDLRALTPLEIEDRLTTVVEAEGLQCESEALRVISRLAQGSMRDAQSLLDRVRAFSDDEKITGELASYALGSVTHGKLIELARCILLRDAGEALKISDAIFSAGSDEAVFVQEFIRVFREILIIAVGDKETLALFGVVRDSFSDILPAIEDAERADLQDLFDIARVGVDIALRSHFTRYALEALIVRMATREPAQDLATLLSKLKSFNQKDSPGRASLRSSTPVKANNAAPLPGKGDSPVAMEQGKAGVEESYDWGGFVDYLHREVSRFLSEQLKRLSVSHFSNGVLKLKGPAFAVEYVSKPEEQERLLRALSIKFPDHNWQLEIESSEANSSSEPGSLHHQGEQQKQDTYRKKQGEVLSHPKLQSLTRMFPGSKVESVPPKG